NIENQQIYKSKIRVSTSNFYSGIYIPRAEDVELLINDSTDFIIKDNESLLYLFEPTKKDQTISIELRLPVSSHGMYSTTQLYVGNYDSIMFVKFREINLRLFIIGLSFTIILISISLYMQKPSEKYLLPLALLALSTFGYVLLKAYPSLQNNFWSSLLLLGPVKLPMLSMDTSRLLYRLFFPILVGFLNYLLIKNFVSVKIFNIDYFFYILPISLLTLLFINDYRYSEMLLAHRIYINILESIVIIKGHYAYKNDTVLLLMGAISATGLNIFIASSGINIIPHGDVDLLFRLGGVYASSYPIAFTIAVNGIFARKYAESETLSKELNHVNKNLQKIVSERTGELKAAYENLEKEQQQKDIFITNMVHSLKSPLFSIAGFADMAQEALQVVPEQVNHFIYLIISNTDFVVKLVNNLFLALRLESGKVNYMIEKTNLCKMMEQIYNTTLPQSQEKDVHIHLEIPEHPVLIKCDFYYLTLAIQNIVDNAVRHTQNGGNITLSIADLGESVEIKVTDNGEGISDEVIDHIFERYYSYSLQGHESSGLGLTISKDVITAHQGQIFVSSKKGEGTEFVIVLKKSEP
ncbi:hypothetical protein JW979_05095, partial [bacterium]|nr:hypothetical protein [candidate division CSSED10-310 bacterium]